jgi:hypothetical protein
VPTNKGYFANNDLSGVSVAISLQELKYFQLIKGYAEIYDGNAKCRHHRILPKHGAAGTTTVLHGILPLSLGGF